MWGQFVTLCNRFYIPPDIKYDSVAIFLNNDNIERNVLW